MSGPATAASGSGTASYSHLLITIFLLRENTVAARDSAHKRRLRVSWSALYRRAGSDTHAQPAGCALVGGQRHTGATHPQTRGAFGFLACPCDRDPSPSVGNRERVGVYQLLTADVARVPLRCRYSGQEPHSPRMPPSFTPGQPSPDAVPFTALNNVATAFELNRDPQQTTFAADCLPASPDSSKSSPSSLLHTRPHATRPRHAVDQRR